MEDVSILLLAVLSLLQLMGRVTTFLFFFLLQLLPRLIHLDLSNRSRRIGELLFGPNDKIRDRIVLGRVEGLVGEMERGSRGWVLEVRGEMEEVDLRVGSRPEVFDMLVVLIFMRSLADTV
jgi:hypothetical protein